MEYHMIMMLVNDVNAEMFVAGSPDKNWPWNMSHVWFNLVDVLLIHALTSVVI